MSRADDHRVADMHMIADEIALVVARGRPAFGSDVVLRRAMKRSLEIIGEAAKAVSADFRAAHPEVSWSAMAKITTGSVTTITA